LGFIKIFKFQTLSSYFMTPSKIMQKASAAFQDWIDQLNDSGRALIVEGREDAKSLRNIGIKNEIIILHSGPRYKLIEHLVKKHKRVVILTDFDKEGKRLYGMLNRELAPFGVHVDKHFREWLQKTTLDQIEGIDTLYRKLTSSSP
jgi:5S rRNA maturation endonuclease (ribonuclease M5)